MEYGNLSIIVYLIYGLAFYTMGICAWLQSNSKPSVLPLTESMKFLSLFGITHGTVEWLIMILIAGIFPEQSIWILEASILLNAISFTFLWMFGINLHHQYDLKSRNFMMVPIIVFLIWLFYFLLYKFLPHLVFNNQILLENLSARYFLGLPGAFTASFALLTASKDLNYQKIVSVKKQLEWMAICFLIYGILAGLIDRKMNFFPAKWINKELFLHVFKVPVEIGRAIVAIIITFLFIRIIQIFRIENEKRLSYLLENQAISRERKSLARELHDVVLQDLFTIGLDIEYLADSKETTQTIQNKLEDLKNRLNDTILKIRDFISISTTGKIEINDLIIRLNQMSIRLKNKVEMDILIIDLTTENTYGFLTSENLTHLFFIIQESVLNGIKHSKGTKITVELKSSLSYLLVFIKDNGVGFETEEIGNFTGYGLKSIMERVKLINGTLNITSNKNGTTVTVLIDWEEEMQ